MTRLPEFDKPSYFGLPENIERSAQRIVSNQVISQLKVLQRADAKASKFDKEVWANELGPVLNLWKKLNTVRMLTASLSRVNYSLVSQHGEIGRSGNVTSHVGPSV